MKMIGKEDFERIKSYLSRSQGKAYADDHVGISGIVCVLLVDIDQMWI